MMIIILPLVLLAQIAKAQDAPTILELNLLNDTFGLYYTSLSMGTPPTLISVSIDTGSDLNWIKCSPCFDCGDTMSNSRLFMPFKSSTFGVVECTTNHSCPAGYVESTGSKISCAQSAVPHICIHKYGYEDGSMTTGYLFRDMLTMETLSAAVAASSAGNDSQVEDQLVFGCGIINTGLEANNNASGILGLSRGPLSIVSQLSLKIFSYCMPNRAHTTNVTGYLVLGDSHPQLPGKPLHYTPMLHDNMAGSPTSIFYYLEVTGISINSMLLDIPTSAFALSSDGQSGGTLLDSGTSFTTLVDEAYTVMEKAFVAAMDPMLVMVSIGNEITCYAVPPSQKGLLVAPRITFHLANMLDLHQSTDQTLHIDQDASDATHDVYCLAYRNAGPFGTGQALNIFGNHQQQGLHIEVDIAGSRLGFATSPTNCDYANTN
ncbi:hypothetical protein GOP47_0008497 [Adiantum capillus-veneris]|uniref:Peptidase A1 domain-containing protein n=1 Tax=Adiantum capillus-veneris TaxID=13818 RepID=A0A9D4ZJR8_ADICA|nr:hypothetical protein GOP47_0008497 [Adiantum capillus-veneris]